MQDTRDDDEDKTTQTGTVLLDKQGIMCCHHHHHHQRVNNSCASNDRTQTRLLILTLKTAYCRSNSQKSQKIPTYHSESTTAQHSAAHADRQSSAPYSRLKQVQRLVQLALLQHLVPPQPPSCQDLLQLELALVTDCQLLNVLVLLLLGWWCLVWRHVGMGCNMSDKGFPCCRTTIHLRSHGSRRPFCSQCRSSALSTQVAHAANGA